MASSTGKNVCLWMIVLGVLALLTGSAAPFWLTIETPTDSIGYGMWFGCVNDVCSTYRWDLLKFEDIPSLFYVLHALVGLASLFAIIVLFLSLCSVCGDGDSVTSNGVLGLLSGVLGVAGAVVFYLEPTESLGAPGSRDWAFIVFIVGSCFVSFFSIVLLLLPKSQNNSVYPY